MAFIEFQISTNVFLEMLKMGMQQQDMCVPTPFNLGGTEFRVDHIEFGNADLRHALPATADVVYLEFDEPRSVQVDSVVTQIAQDITIFVVTTADVLAHPNTTPANIIPFPLTAVLNLTYYPIDDQCYLRVIPGNLEFGDLGALPPGVDAATVKALVSSVVMSLFPSKAIPFTFANVLTGAQVPVQNADVSAGGNGSFLAFRAQLGDLDVAVAENAWEEFYKGNLADRRGGRDFALFFPKTYLETYFQLQLEHNMSSGGEFDLIGDTVTYYNVGTEAHFSVEIDGNVHLPDPLTTKYVAFSLSAVLSVPKANTVQTDLDVPSDKELADMILGSFPAISVALLGPVGLALNGLVRGQIHFPPLTTPLCVQTSDTHYQCKQGFPTTALPTGTALNVDALYAQTDGASFGGAITVVPLTPADLTLTLHEFEWQPPQIHCGSAGVEMVAAVAADPAALITAHAYVFLNNSGTVPIKLCNVQVMEGHDPANAFPPGALTVDQDEAPLRITLNAPVPGSAFNSAPYPCDLLATTTGGVRLIRLRPAGMLTPADILKAEANMLRQLADCEKLVDPWKAKYFNPMWLVDPPVERSIDHIWTFNVTGLSARETVLVEDAHGNEVARAMGNTSQEAQLWARTSPARENEIRLSLSSGNELLAFNRRPRVSMSQQLLTNCSTVTLPTMCRNLEYNIGRSILAFCEDTILTFDLTNPYRPELTGVTAAGGVRGAIRVGHKLVGFGDAGFYELVNQRRVRAMRNGCRPMRVLDAKVSGGLVYALTDREVQVFHGSLTYLYSIPTVEKDNGVLLPSGDWLFVGGSHGVSCYDISRPEQVEKLAHVDVEVVRLRQSPDARKDSVLAVLQGGGSVHLQVVRGEMVHRGVFREAAWFARGMRIGKVMAALRPQGDVIEVGILGSRVNTDADANGGPEVLLLRGESPSTNRPGDLKCVIF